MAAGAIWHFGATWKGFAAMVMLLALVPVVVIDLEHKLIPNIVVYPAAAIALAAMVLNNPAKWWVPVSAAAGAAGFLWLLGKIKPGGMGLGDAKLALLLGAVLGASVIPAFFIAFLAGSILGAVLMAKFGMQARKYQIPFGPYLALGAVVALFAGPSLISLYTDRIH
jgi:prepilin signal peptidase PulO-like enzyme (type II secretory pathway)